VPVTRTAFHPLTVAEVARLCDDAVAVSFDVPASLSEAYQFQAGQWLTLRRTVAGQEERRSYSICAAEGDPLRIGVREVPDGVISSWLVHQVRPGDQIDVGTPAGTFTTRATAGQHVLIGAGSGITPLLSIASTVLRDPAANAIVFYVNRQADTVMFADELADLKDRYPARLELAHILSRELREPELFSGRLDSSRLKALMALLPDPAAVDHWWLCGPLGLVATTEDMLRDLGIPGGRIHKELFYADDELPQESARHEDAPVAGVASELTVVLDGRATTIGLPADTAVLDGAQRVRPDLPFACKGGVCGTCRAKLLSGTVHMRRNFALEEAELAAGYILTCQSYPDSDSLVVDYDA
jgi:ring-1,2-phenylacetyl-CoA epoxidase subunit PaaE